jgi:toxin FitB
VTYLLDTNVISELRRPDRTHPSVAAWVDSVDPLELFLSAITIFEIEIGVLRFERRDARQGASLRAWMDTQVLPTFDGRIIPVDVAVAQRCARLHVPNPRAERDALIAATALAHRLTVVTRNVADFQPMGVDIINPWDG